jgi:flagellar basal-body rod modification protein FlgD
MVDAINPNTATDRINAGSGMLASNFETFLSLLTAQLRNQDPLSPVDSNQFTAQLTQMAGVEQQLLTNELLKSMLAGQTVGLGDAATYIGRDVTAAWSATMFKDGEANWNYELASNASTVELQVLDGVGNVVWKGDAPDKTTGVHEFNWDGELTTGGQAQEDKVYTLKIVAKDTAGNAIDSQILTKGRVTGIEMYDGEAYLTVGNTVLPVSTVIALEEAAAQNADIEDPGEDENALAALASNFNPLKLFS